MASPAAAQRKRSTWTNFLFGGLAGMGATCVVQVRAALARLRGLSAPRALRALLPRRSRWTS